MLLTCPLEKEGVIVKPTFFHFLSPLAGYHLALLKLTSLLYVSVQCLKACLFSWKKKGESPSWELPLCSFCPWPHTSVLLFSTAMSQLPCKPRHRRSLAALPFASPIHPSGSAITKLRNRSLCAHTSTRYQRLNKICPRQFLGLVFEITCLSQTLITMLRAAR